jgi:translation initiation factor IF-1
MMEGHFNKVFDQVKFLVKEEVSRTLGATTLAIALVANKTFLSKHLLNKDRKGPVEVLKGDKLHQVIN